MHTSTCQSSVSKKTVLDSYHLISISIPQIRSTFATCWYRTGHIDTQTWPCWYRSAAPPFCVALASIAWKVQFLNNWKLFWFQGPTNKPEGRHTKQTMQQGSNGTPHPSHPIMLCNPFRCIFIYLCLNYLSLRDFGFARSLGVHELAWSLWKACTRVTPFNFLKNQFHRILESFAGSFERGSGVMVFVLAVQSKTSDIVTAENVYPPLQDLWPSEASQTLQKSEANGSFVT